MGDKGITPTFIRELDTTLEHHELIKVRVRTGDRETRDASITSITEATGAIIVTRVGNIATLYRPRKKKPGIVLPPAMA
jgi:RNA-binding protein